MRTRGPKAALAAVMLAGVTALAGCQTTSMHANKTEQGITSKQALNLPKDPSYSGPVVATYKGGSLTKQELDDAYNLQVVLPGSQNQVSKSDFLKYYIVWYKYLYDKAASSATTPINGSQAKQQAAQIMQQLQGTQYKTTADVQNKMKSLGISQDDLVRMVEKEQIIQQYLQAQLKNVTVSDADAQAYYNQNKSQFIQVSVDQVLLKSESDAQKVEASLKSGASFATEADKYSIDPSAKQNHGHLDNALTGEFVPEFASACASLPLHQISSPIHSQYGYHVLRVDSRKQLTYEQAKSQITQQLLPQEQGNARNQLANTAEKAADIKVVSKSL